jgi:uncharacterized membrane protein
MYTAILTSFGIRSLNDGFAWLHRLSTFTVAAITVALWAAHAGRDDTTARPVQPKAILR